MVFSWRFGGRDGTVFVIAIIAASLATFSLNSLLGITNSLPAIIAINILLLIFVIYRVIVSDKYWPIWFAGFHGAGVITGITALLFPTAQSGVYHNLAGFWALPAILSMIIGIVKDRQKLVI